MPVEVLGDGLALIGPVAEEGLDALFDAEVEDFDSALDEGGDGAGLAGAGVAFEEDVRAGDGRGGRSPGGGGGHES